MSNNLIIVSIEGNIGSGKSTLLDNLRETYKNDANIVFLKEPVDEWEKIKDENGITILEKFYSDQIKYSFSFQMMAYVSRLKVLRDELKNIQFSENKKTIKDAISKFIHFVGDKIDLKKQVDVVYIELNLLHNFTSKDCFLDLGKNGYNIKQNIFFTNNEFYYPLFNSLLLPFVKLKRTYSNRNGSNKLLSSSFYQW